MFQEIKKWVLRSSFYGLFIAFFFGCQDELEIDKYERPDWLTGKLYSQILTVPELSNFTKCLEITGYDTLINTSGSYTVFAPSDEAFEKYFSLNPDYSSVEDLPSDKIMELVKYHILQDAWSLKQLKSLDVFGWIDTLDISNSQPRGFKRQTLLLDKDRKFGVEFNEDDEEGVVIVDTISSDWHRKVSTDSRKYAPFFYKEYFQIYNLEYSDYEFYFKRPFDNADDIHFANAKIVSNEIFAENGFIFIIDEVVPPLRNVYQILEEKQTLESYSMFLELVNQFPDFDYNEQKTFRQPGVELGLTVDSLFDLTFPKLLFDISNERTSPPRGVTGLPQEVTVRYHHGILAPSNSAFEDFLTNYIDIPNGWGTVNQMPEHIRRMIVNTHLSINPVYPSDYTKGFYNGELDIVRLNENQIVESVFCSNSSFIGLNDMVVPRAFKGITGPVFLNRGFSMVMYAIEKTKLLPALKREKSDYMLFVAPDLRLLTDSSLIYNPFDENFFAYLTGDEPLELKLSIDDVRNLVFNHVGLRNPSGNARKEFIPNMAGNYLIVNNETGEFSGTSPTTNGFEGSEFAPEYPKLIPFNADNGSTYEINNWFSFSASDLYSKIQTDYPHFHSLLKAAGLVLEKEYRYSFISNSENYTIFIPNEESLMDLNTDSLSTEELAKFLLIHFVQGSFIFTDGSAAPGYYETLRPDEKSTAFSKVYTKIFIETGFDLIRFKGNNETVYLEVEESDQTNIITSKNLSQGNAIIKDIRANAVIHEINRPLIFKQLDTN